MTDLTKQLVKYMHELGVPDVNLCTRNHIRRKLELEFQNALSFFPNTTGKLLVYSDNLTMEQLVIDNSDLRKELDTLKNKSSDIDAVLKAAAYYLGSGLKEVRADMSWITQTTDMTSAANMVPDCVNKFLQLIISG